MKQSPAATWLSNSWRVRSSFRSPYPRSTNSLNSLWPEKISATHARSNCSRSLAAASFSWASAEVTFRHLLADSIHLSQQRRQLQVGSIVEERGFLRKRSKIYEIDVANGSVMPSCHNGIGCVAVPVTRPRERTKERNGVLAELQCKVKWVRQNFTKMVERASCRCIRT